MRGRRAGHFSALTLAGWLFADMLLVLVVIALGDQADPVAAEVASKPRVSASTRPSPSPTPTGPRSVELKPVVISVRAGLGDRAAMTRQLEKATAPYQGRTAALVLTFGHHGEPAPGQTYARRVNEVLRKARPDMFNGTATRSFWSGGAPGKADLEIYFYTR